MIKLHVSDFGFAITKSDHQKSSYHHTVGTPTYLAYEMLVPSRWDKNERNVIFYDEKVDIWCLGICLYAMLYQTTPFMTSPFDK
jgi:serine/threonine protein kinase